MGRIKKVGKRHLVAVDEDIFSLLDEASSKVDQHVTQYVRELVINKLGPVKGGQNPYDGKRIPENAQVDPLTGDLLGDGGF